MLALGIMSGTSLDGIDIAICEIDGINEKTTVQLEFFKTFVYPELLKNKTLRAMSDPHFTVAELTELNFELGELFGNCALEACKEFSIASSDLAYIASHGQTIYHIPKNTDYHIPSTLQIGESAVIAAKCECPVISNFREMDIALNGEGAPLVPFSERILYQSPNKNVALQNIGGVGNVTIIPQTAQDGIAIFGFDTGPGNVLINELMMYFYQKSYDYNGEKASSGNLNQDVQQFLMSHPYLSKTPPKSVDRETFGRQFAEKLVGLFPDVIPNDMIATATWFTAYCIQDSYNRFIKNRLTIDKWVVGGGGAHNKILMNWIQKLLPDIEILSQEQLGFSSDAKEAIAFIILGNQTFHRQASNVPSVTGASKEAVLGKITYPPTAI